MDEMDGTQTATTNCKWPVLDLEKMKKLLKSQPKIYAVDYGGVLGFPYRINPILSENTIIISQDLADTLGLIPKEPDQKAGWHTQECLGHWKKTGEPLCMNEANNERETDTISN